MAWWHIIQKTNMQFDDNIHNIVDLPYTISAVIRRRIQIDSFLELPKEKRPPRCLHVDTKILIMDSGRIRQVVIGELVGIWRKILILTPYGFRKVTNLETSNQPSLRLRFSHLDEVSCSYNHKFPVSTRGAKTVVDMLSDNLSLSLDSEKGYGLFRAIEEFLPNTLTIYCGTELDYSFGYFIGLYAAEGGIYHNTLRFTIHEDEIDILDNIKIYMDKLGIKNIPFNVRATGGTFKYGKHRSDSGKKVIRIKVCSKELTNKVANIVSGKCTEKSLDVDWILNTNKRFREGIVRGLLDGDGCYKNDNKTRFSFISSSKKLRDDLSLLLSSVGILCSKNAYTTFDNRYNKVRSSYTINSRVGRNGVTRKINNNYQLPLTLKEYDNSVDMVDIEVEGELFIINDGLITHNSIWDKPSELEDWFELAFNPKKQTEFGMAMPDESQIE